MITVPQYWAVPGPYGPFVNKFPIGGYNVRRTTGQTGVLYTNPFFSTHTINAGANYPLAPGVYVGSAPGNLVSTSEAQTAYPNPQGRFFPTPELFDPPLLTPDSVIIQTFYPLLTNAPPVPQASASGVPFKRTITHYPQTDEDNFRYAPVTASLSYPDELATETLYYGYANASGGEFFVTYSNPPQMGYVYVWRPDANNPQNFYFEFNVLLGSFLSYGDYVFDPAIISIECDWGDGSTELHACNQQSWISGSSHSATFSKILPPYNGVPDANGNVAPRKIIRARVVDRYGRRSPWYRFYLAPQAALTAKWGDDGFLHLDATGSYDIDGSLTFQFGPTGASPETTGWGTARIALDALAPFGFPQGTGPMVQVSVLVTDSDGLTSSAQVLVPLPASLSQIGSLHLPTGAMLTAQTQNTNGAKSVPVFYWQNKTNPATVSTIQNAEKPTLIGPLVGNHRSGAVCLMARDVASSSWRLWRSLDGARTLSPMATVFSSSLIDYAHAVAIPGGACAVAVLKASASATTGTLIFKRTGDLSKWPDDSKAITVQSGVANAPFHVLASAQGQLTLSITDGKTLWLQSTNGGRDWK